MELFVVGMGFKLSKYLFDHASDGKGLLLWWISYAIVARGYVISLLY